jgi:hypothetical protein
LLKIWFGHFWKVAKFLNLMISKKKDKRKFKNSVCIESESIVSFCTLRFIYQPLANIKTIMNEFQLKYQYLNKDDFLTLVIVDYKKSKEEKLFNQIITPRNLETKSFETLVSMKVLLKSFKPKNQDLIDEISTLLIKVNKALTTKT